MQIKTHKQYEKSWKKLTPLQRDRALGALTQWLKAPTSPALRLHQLKGEYYPQYSISAGRDLRFHFLTVSPDTIVLMAIGTHAQLYG
ncbi:MAG TPA: hypothetical protein VF572_03655 [Candidatus Saccharimonadales bacterium]|jgi:mRNA-degrading endonuclease YafQ of YafQ-DinJ toxin-antitoxin module